MGLYVNGKLVGISLPQSGGNITKDQIIVKSATIPTAGEDYVGAVYQYVGETNSTYTHGYIYECKAVVESNTTTYAWERMDVQPGATRGRFLALWNCATGLAESNPPSSPYPYGVGDYYIVGTVGTTNYKPSGSSYVIGTASSTVETDDVAVNDTYYYDGTNWNLQKNTATTVDQTYDPTSINAQSGTAVAQAIAGITIPTVNDATLTISQNGVLKGTFSANSSTNVNVLLENLPADFVNNQNSAQTATTPLKVWEGTSSDYADQTSSTGTFYAWDMGSGGWTGYTMEYPITNSSVIYWYSAGDYGPTSNTIIYTDGTAMFVRDDYEEFHYAPEKNIGGSNIGPDTICFVEGVGVKRNGVDIANLSNYTAGTGIDITDGVISETNQVEIVNFTRDLTDTSVLKIIPSTSGYTFPKDKIYVLDFSLRQDPVQGEPTQIDDNTPITMQDGTGRGINFMISGYQATTFKDIKAFLRSKVNPNNKRTTYYGCIIGILGGVGSAPYNMSFRLLSADNNPADMQTTTNLVTSVSSSSTDTQYPSAKLLYDTVGNIEATLDAIIAQGSNS